MLPEELKDMPFDKTLSRKIGFLQKNDPKMYSSTVKTILDGCRSYLAQREKRIFTYSFSRAAAIWHASHTARKGERRSDEAAKLLVNSKRTRSFAASCFCRIRKRHKRKRAASAIETAPFISNAGADGVKENGKRAYSSYISVAAPFKLGGLDWTAEVGATPWETDFYEAGGFAVCDVSLEASKEIRITRSFSLPLFAKVTWNPCSERAYFVAGLGF